MQPLDRASRNQLEHTIKDARDVAEAAAEAALEQLGVRETKPYSHLNELDRDLRRRLRVHGRQFGDHRKPNGEQATDRLVEKVAYEHWHRMLVCTLPGRKQSVDVSRPGWPRGGHPRRV